MIYLARSLMLLGMADLLFGLYMGIAKGSMRQELLFFAIGVALFAAGWWLRKKLGEKGLP